MTSRIAYKALRCIKLKKSAGPDPVPNLVWKEFAFELSPVACNLYNSSLTVGYIPDILKESLVHPVPKCSPPKSITDDLRSTRRLQGRIRGMRKQLTQIVQLQSTSSTGRLRKMAKDYQKDTSVI